MSSTPESPERTIKSLVDALAPLGWELVDSDYDDAGGYGTLLLRHRCGKQVMWFDDAESSGEIWSVTDDGMNVASFIGHASTVREIVVLLRDGSVE